MTLKPPTPPTAPAPAIRPTPPTPPSIDRTPFVKEKSADTPENMARDAVANGSGALTKRTVDKGKDENPPANQTVTVIPPDAPIISDEQSDYDRGQDVLRQFREEDSRSVQPKENFQTGTETESPRNFTPTLNQQAGHGGAYWIFTIIFVAVAAFIIVKKFLFTDKPALTKSQIFDDEKIKSPPTPARIPAKKFDDEKMKSPPTPARIPQKKSDDDKGKHFEIRV